MTREKALEEIKSDVYTEAEVNDDLEYVAKKLDWTPQEFRDIIAQPPRMHKEFANNDLLFSSALKTKRIIGSILSMGRKS
jgi:hypothetical protein